MSGDTEQLNRRAFGRSLRRLRERYDLTQQALAAEHGLTQATVSSWESGRRAPDLHSLVTLAGFFDVSVDELLGRDTLLCVVCRDEEATFCFGCRAPDSERS